ncbi:MAG: GNAT family N-acetyltransferase [Rhodobacterales bacterium]|nr:GNAT family N-acetyltransferase [Rhodobacterales bacterium]
MRGRRGFYVACDGDVVRGTFQLTLMTGLLQRSSRRAEVEGVRVLATARRGGIGRLIMAEAVETGRERRAVVWCS